MATKTINQRQAVRAIANREAFEASALSATWSGYPGWGRMASEDIDTLKASLKASDGMLYVVSSYTTPIAWWDGNVWTIPATKFSVTTSKHQGIVRYAARF